MTMTICSPTYLQNEETKAELMHFGVLGMKWGVRKEYEPVGRQSSSTIKPKSKHRTKLEEKYLSKGMSQEDAEKRAANRIKTEKIIAITAGVTLAAATAYVIKNHHAKQYADELIDKGTIYNRIARSPDGHLSEKTFVSFLPEDLQVYKDNLTFKNDLQNKSTIYQVSLKGVNQIRMPSQKMQEKILLDIVRENPKYVRENIIKSEYYNRLSDKKLTKSAFTQLSRYFSDKPLTDQFNSAYANELKKRGYNAVIDWNDFGVWTKKPLILLDALNDVANIGSTVIRN